MAKYILANNARALSVGVLAEGVTSLVLDEISATMTAALDEVDTDEKHILLTLTDGIESAHEIVEVTAWVSGTSTATIVRAQDGTADQEWPAESVVEIRLCREALTRLWHGPGLDSIDIGKDNVQTYSDGDETIVIGNGNETYSDNVVIIANRGSAGMPRCIVIGDDAAANDDDCIAIGYGCDNYGDEGSISIGADIMSSSVKGITLGCEAQNWADFTLALGAHAVASSVHVSHCAAIFGQVSTSSLSSAGTLHEDDIVTRHRAAPLMTLATGILDLTDDTDFYEIELPSGGHFFPDRIDVIITGVDIPGGAPAIQVGTDDSANIDNILADSAVTVDAAHQRQVFTPDSLHGVDNIRVSVKTAGSGTTYNCRVVVTGFMVEDE